MKRIIVASKNPVKIEAVRLAFGKMFADEIFDIDSHSVDSGVSDQPMSDEETLQGARNRMENVSEKEGADFWVGIEGGIDVKDEKMEAFAWVVIKDSLGKQGQACTATFILPPEIKKLVEQGKELGVADDIVFSRTNSKQSNGAVGLLTQDKVTRTTYYEHAIMLALIPFKNSDLYS